MAYTKSQAIRLILEHLEAHFDFESKSGVAYGSALATDDEETTLADLVQIAIKSDLIVTQPMAGKLEFSCFSPPRITLEGGPKLILKSIYDVPKTMWPSGQGEAVDVLVSIKQTPEGDVYYDLERAPAQVSSEE